MKTLRTVLLGCLFGDATLHILSSRSFGVVLTVFVVGVALASKLEPRNIQRLRGSGKTANISFSLTLNVLTLSQLERTSTVFPSLNLSLLAGEDNAEWLQIASSAMYSDSKDVHFSLFYHIFLSIFNGLQVLVNLISGRDIGTISTPINSVNAAYLAFLLLFPWLSFSVANHRKSPGKLTVVRLVSLLAINLMVLGALSEAYRIGHLSAAATIFFGSLAIISVFSKDDQTVSQWLHATLPLSAAFMLWHPLRPLGLAVAVTAALSILKHRDDRPIQFLARVTKNLPPRTPLIVLLASIVTVGFSTVLTGIFGVVASIARSLPGMQNMALWQTSRSSYLDKLIGAAGGTIQVSSALAFILIGVAFGGFTFAHTYRPAYRLHSTLAITLVAYLLAVVVLDALDDGVRSYGPLKMTWIFVPFLCCLIFSTIFIRDLASEDQVRLVPSVLVSLALITTAYALEDTGRLGQFLAAPGLKESKPSEQQLLTRGSDWNRWDTSADVEKLKANGALLGCVVLTDSGSVMENFDAYSCGRRLYRVALTSETIDEKTSTALMWRSLGRLSDSEMMGMLAKYATPETMPKRVLLLSVERRLVGSASLSEFASIVMLGGMADG